MIHKDMLGNEVKVGDFVAYAVREGNTGIMKVGKVFELKSTTSNEYDYNTKTYRDVEVPQFKVRGLHEFWNGTYQVGKLSTLSHKSRIVVVPITSVPDAIKEMYK